MMKWLLPSGTLLVLPLLLGFFFCTFKSSVIRVQSIRMRESLCQLGLEKKRDGIEESLTCSSSSSSRKKQLHLQRRAGSLLFGSSWHFVIDQIEKVRSTQSELLATLAASCFFSHPMKKGRKSNQYCCNRNKRWIVALFFIARYLNKSLKVCPGKKSHRIPIIIFRKGRTINPGDNCKVSGFLQNNSRWIYNRCSDIEKVSLFINQYPSESKLNRYIKKCNPCYRSTRHQIIVSKCKPCCSSSCQEL